MLPSLVSIRIVTCAPRGATSPLIAPTFISHRFTLLATFHSLHDDALVRVLRGSWCHDRLALDLALQVLDRRVQLRITAEEGGVGQVVDHDVRIDAVAFDEPCALGS